MYLRNGIYYTSSGYALVMWDIMRYRSFFELGASFDDMLSFIRSDFSSEEDSKEILNFILNFKLND